MTESSTPPPNSEGFEDSSRVDDASLGLPRKVTYWNYTFTLTEEHLVEKAKCEQLRQEYDVLADECLEILDQIAAEEEEKTREGGKGRSGTGRQGSDDGTRDKGSDAIPVPEQSDDSIRDETSPTPNTRKAHPKKHSRDYYALLETHHTSHPTLHRLWTEVTTIPSWVDWSQIRRGQDVFYRYAGPMFVGLTFSSLVGGLGAGRVVETLARTGGFNPKVVRRRLFETTQFVLEVTRSIGDIMPVGMEEEKEGQTGEQQKDTEINKSSPKPNTPQSQASPLSNKTSNPPSAHLGFKSSLRVRLLHSSVRRRILQLTQRHSSYYQTTEHGIPINTLHNIGTLGTFSTLLIYRSLPRQGIRLTRGEITSYISLWRLIAHYLTGSALITSYFSHAESARLIMEVLLMTEVTPTRLSRTLTSSILTSIANHPPAYPTQRFLEASIRWCNGNAISNHLLGPQHPPFYYKILVAGQCLFFIATCSPLLHLRWWRWWCPYSSNTNNKLTEWILAHDANRIHRIRSLSWKAIVESKWGLQGQTTDFAFKYIPGIDFVEVANTSTTTTTTEEGYVDDEKRKFSPTKKNFLSSSRLRERRAVMAMGLACVGVVGVAWSGWIVFRGVCGLMRFIFGYIVQYNVIYYRLDM